MAKTAVITACTECPHFPRPVMFEDNEDGSTTILNVKNVYCRLFEMQNGGFLTGGSDSNSDNTNKEQGSLLLDDYVNVFGKMSGQIPEKCPLPDNL